jgi:hypothetical protein
MMGFKRIEWNRETLYEQIWTTPLRTVAKEYGLSDVGLAKICRKLRIPRPGLGYWRRKECGFKVSRPPLPVVTEELKLVSHIPDAPPPKQNQDSDPPLPPLKPARPTQTVHPLVKETGRAFSSKRADQFGRVRPSDWRLPRLDLRVTADGLDRALKFMDSLIRLLEANNMTVSVGSGHEPAATIIDVDGEQIKAVLKEYVHGRRRELTPDERRNHERFPSVYKQDTALVYESTNRFEFEITAHRHWTDSKRYTIEQFLEQIANGFRAAAQSVKRVRANREAQWRREQEEARQLREEQARIDRLKKSVSEWHEAQRIRAYLASVRQKAEIQEGGITKDSPVAQFLSWAERHADSLDDSGSPLESDGSDEEY